ncbi:MAG: restriction endonuclease subunit S [Bacteroidales bacterium]|nr:restriction endonuclease subunit S [Bacteroidales bacterium]MCM1147888.1 restriction endonuclease subunit S [Bacteroidales bacterium]MCM1206731.1 restriction endonuclease subunit S [Bacillota bacterium]MCM1510927.1 restriction endonuclease subunit S [Clostridium sp.]
MKNKDTYKRLGDYIRQVDVRNKDLAVEKLLGLSIAKQFIPSIANTIGTDMSNYKIVKPHQFGYVPVTSRNGDKITVALYEEEEPCIISQAYVVFEVHNEDRLLPEYLMMWFRRPEFDRYARFKSHGSAREVFEWEEMCEVMLPVPSIEEQQKIVAEYQAIEQRIENNRRLIATLESTAQTIYRKMFVDDIDMEHLPDGWRMGTIGEFCKETKSGGTPSRSNAKYWSKPQYRWLKSGEVANNIIFETEEYISEDGLNESSAKIIPSGTVVMAMYGATASQVAYLACDTTTNQACCNMLTNSFEEAAYLYFHCLFKQEEIKRFANGGAQENLSQDVICNQPIILAPPTCFKHFAVLLKTKIAYSAESLKLQEMLYVIQSRLSS